jgi:hypothetical protein
LLSCRLITTRTLCDSPHNNQLKQEKVQVRDMAPSRANTRVVVVGGGGTIGSSTALHLVRSGYSPSNITVLDTYPIPSSQSAGNDLNKIMGIRLRNKVDLQLSLEARQMWKEDDLFKEFFHNTGRVSQEPTMILEITKNSDSLTARLCSWRERCCRVEIRLSSPS